MRKFIIMTLVVILVLLSLSGGVQALVVGEPDEFDVELMQGWSAEKKITITNHGNVTVSGHIEVRNVECGFTCPGASISIPGGNRVELEPGESVEAEIRISSQFLNTPQEITLPIILETGDDLNETTLARIHVTVHINYPICIGLPGILILIIVLYLHNKKFKTVPEPKQESDG